MGVCLRALLFAALVSPARGAFSGVPSCAVQDKGYDDPAVTSVNGGIEIADAQACQDACSRLVTCRVFTYYVNSGGCWLQGISGTVPPLKDIKGALSGPSVCPAGSGGANASANATLPVPVVVALPNASSANATEPRAAAVAQPASGGMWWWLIIIGVVVLSLLACALFFFSQQQHKKKGGRKSRRREKQSEEASESPKESRAAETVPLVADPGMPPVKLAPLNSSPAYSYAPSRVIVSSPPRYAQPAPAPAYMHPRAATSMTMVAPAAPQEPTMFDRMDANHDGSVTREEFAKVFGPK